jgi:hypothetical protein
LSEETVELRPLKRKRRIIRYPSAESYRSDGEVIRGPLGIWFFPILNALLRFIRALRRQPTPTVQPERRRRMVIHEIVRDEKGRIVEIVEREVEDVD